MSIPPTPTPQQNSAPASPSTLTSQIGQHIVKWGQTGYPSYITSAAYLASIPAAILRVKGFPSFVESSVFFFANAGAGYITTQDWASGSQIGTLASLTHFIFLLRKNFSLVPPDSPSYYARSTNRGLSLASLFLHGTVAGNTIIQAVTWKAGLARRAEWVKTSSSSSSSPSSSSSTSS